MKEKSKSFMNRKKFFTAISLGAIGFTIFNSFPFNIISPKTKKSNQQIKIKINPLAVSRKKIGEKNV
jgi:hypothetical protein